MRPAPWITGQVISEGGKLAGASLVHLPLDDIRLDDGPPDVPPDVPAPRVVTRPLPVVAGRLGRHRAPPRDAEPGPPADPAGRHRADDVPAPHDDDWIVGIAAAALYLGYDKPESFRRARTRHPIPGEHKTPDGRPCWMPAALRSWQSKRKIAGNRTHGSEAE